MSGCLLMLLELGLEVDDLRVGKQGRPGGFQLFDLLLSQHLVLRHPRRVQNGREEERERRRRRSHLKLLRLEFGFKVLELGFDAFAARRTRGQ